jgi:hypothetical protein
MEIERRAPVQDVEYPEHAVLAGYGAAVSAASQPVPLSR